jgi:hypothetical protein
MFNGDNNEKQGCGHHYILAFSWSLFGAYIICVEAVIVKKMRLFPLMAKKM